MARGLRSTIKLPNWAQKTGLTIAQSFILVVDQMIQVVLEWVNAKYPGLGTPTALPLIGQTRGLVQGETQTDDAFAAQLRAWLDFFQNDGGDNNLAISLQTYIGNTPLVRIITRSGHFFNLNTDGTFSFAQDSGWDWDSVSNPERAGYWSDIWVVLFPTEWPITGTTLSSLGSQINSLGAVGLGHAVPQETHDVIMSLLKQRKAAHCYLDTIVWSYDSSLFVPGDLGAPGNPDGSWGFWGNRNPNLRYWSYEPTL